MSRPQTTGDFKCAHCGHIVSSAHWLSGVQNRNHCPYCLWSRHLDLYAAGDRLSACKAPMQPVALTCKRSRNKYSRGRGELMLVHLCTGCGEVSINRIAADDDAETLLEAFKLSLALPGRTLGLLWENEIDILPPDSLPLLQLQLFGSTSSVRMAEIA
jgi:DNA-directed RNA polymerase subunit RPC12/RpoP